MRLSYQGLRLERVRASRQWRDGVFRNTAPVGPGLKSSPLPLLGEFFFSGAERTPRAALPLSDPRPAWARAPQTGLRLTWLGHSTVLLELDGARVLTDPVFGERASPLSFAGPRRFHPVPVALSELPPLDLVVLSHDHYDHLCRDTMAALARMSVPIVTALGVGARLEALGIDARRITELDWHESTQVGPLRVTAAPSQHFSGRAVGDRNHTLWASWVLEGLRHKVYFSGDTGLTDEFRSIGERYGPFDLVMLEVGAWNEAWGDIHLGPKNALRAFDMLGGGALLPVHWGTFNLALHAWDEPVETLLAEAGGRRIVTPGLGRVVELAHVEGATPWWRELSAERSGCLVSGT
jgi:L-ascorbate metabolism protein UlaG (beta-lactamase superfamily)